MFSLQQRLVQREATPPPSGALMWGGVKGGVASHGFDLFTLLFLSVRTLKIGNEVVRVDIMSPFIVYRSCVTIRLRP